MDESFVKINFEFHMLPFEDSYVETAKTFLKNPDKWEVESIGKDWDGTFKATFTSEKYKWPQTEAERKYRKEKILTIEKQLRIGKSSN